jgi:hypothetical protein
MNMKIKMRFTLICVSIVTTSTLWSMEMIKMIFCCKNRPSQHKMLIDFVDVHTANQAYRMDIYDQLKEYEYHAYNMLHKRGIPFSRKTGDDNVYWWEGNHEEIIDPYTWDDQIGLIKNFREKPSYAFDFFACVLTSGYPNLAQWAYELTDKQFNRELADASQQVVQRRVEQFSNILKGLDALAQKKKEFVYKQSCQLLKNFFICHINFEPRLDKFDEIFSEIKNRVNNHAEIQCMLDSLKQSCQASRATNVKLHSMQAQATLTDLVVLHKP